MSLEREGCLLSPQEKRVDAIGVWSFENIPWMMWEVGVRKVVQKRLGGV